MDAIEKIKTYFVEVGMKYVGPRVTAALMSAIIAFIVAHQEFMEKMGITYYAAFDGIFHGTPPTGQILIVEFDTLGKWGAAMLIVGFTAAWSLLQHHTTATVTGAPQSGDKRTDPPMALTGGDRKNDPKETPQ